MAEESPESIIRMAHAQLLGLQGNIPDTTARSEFIDLFHSIINDLESLGADLSRFKIPPEAMHYGNGDRGLSTFFKAKVDGLLVMFSVSENKQQIGFMASN